MDLNFDNYWKNEFNKSSNIFKNDWEISKWTKSGFSIRYEKVKEYIYSISREFSEDYVALDLGSGPGAYTKFLSSYNINVISIDYSFSVLKKGKENGKIINGIAANAKYIPIKDRAIDLVICVGVLQHIEPFEKLLKEVKRILKPRGKFILITRNSLYYKDLYQYQGYIRSFFPHAMKDYFILSGFTAIKLTPIILKRLNQITIRSINYIFKVKIFSIIILLFSRAFMIVGRKNVTPSNS